MIRGTIAECTGRIVQGGMIASSIHGRTQRNAWASTKTPRCTPSIKHRTHVYTRHVTRSTSSSIPNLGSNSARPTPGTRPRGQSCSEQVTACTNEKTCVRETEHICPLSAGFRMLETGAAASAASRTKHDTSGVFEPVVHIQRSSKTISPIASQRIGLPWWVWCRHRKGCELAALRQFAYSQLSREIGPSSTSLWQFHAR
jgi:hypothetical protein